MTDTTLHEQRRAAIDQAVANIRTIAARGVTRHDLAAIQQQLLALAARRDLFRLDDFLNQPGDDHGHRLYRLSEDDDHRFALYAQLASGGADTPVHNHTTWAVIVGVQGDELNRLYERDSTGGVRLTGEQLVTAGTGIAFMPDDLHSIHIAADQPVLNFHMYGLGLEQLHEREYYDAETDTWAHFKAIGAIRDLPRG